MPCVAKAAEVGLLALAEAAGHVRDGVEAFLHVILGPDEYVIGNAREILDELDGLANVIENARGNCGVETFAPCTQVFLEIAQHEARALETHELLHDQALEESFRARLDGEDRRRTGLLE